MNLNIMFARTFMKVSNICSLGMKVRRFSCNNSNNIEIVKINTENIKKYSEHNYETTKFIMILSSFNWVLSIAILLIK
jgi:hypothetical protein